MKTTVTELEDSRARVEVEVPADEVSVQVQRAARALAREMRMPGFRKGKAPPSLAISRLGFATVFEEALQEALPGWYEKAVYAAGVTPIGAPDVELTEPARAEGDTVSFQFEVGVRPTAELGEYLDLEVPRASDEVPEKAIDRELERLREGMSSLEPVDRPAAEGDHLLTDFVGRVDDVEFDGGAATDHTIIIGAGQLIDDFEEQLIGASAGDEVNVEVTFPEDYGNAELAGHDATFAVTVKEVREQQLPDLDDDFAVEASEFDTLAELRDDITRKLAETAAERIDQAFRAEAIDAVVDNAKVAIPENIVRARSEERWERVERQLAAQGMNPDTYLQAQGQTRDDIINESLDDAEREIRRESVLVAVAKAEEIEAEDAELEEELAHMASHERVSPAKLLERLRREGRDEMVAADVRVRKAIDRLVESAREVAMDAAEAAEKIWGIRPEEDAGDDPATESETAEGTDEGQA